MIIEKERRQFVRAGVTWPATIIASKSQFPGELKNISQVGASLYCKDLPDLGQEFRLEMKPPRRQPIMVSAKPIWALETDSFEVSRRFVIGVKFEYIADLLPMFSSLRHLRDRNVNV